MKRFFNLVGGIFVVALSAISCTFAYTQEQEEAYQWAYKYKLTTQPTIEAAKLDSPITRQAFSKMIINYLGNVAGVTYVITSNPCSFPDENMIIKDLIPYVKQTCNYDIMGKNESNFNPTKYLSRAQLGTALSRVLWGDKYDSVEKKYYIYHLNALKQNGIMGKISNPQAYAKRGDVLVMFKRIYDKFGSNVNLSGNQVSPYSGINLEEINSNTGNKTNESKSTGDIVPNDKISNSSTNKNEENKYLSALYEKSNVIYTGKNGIKYYYDDKFLGALKTTAEKKGESDLAKYLEIEANYFKQGLDQLGSLDLDSLSEMLGVKEDEVDFKSMTTKEKEELIKKLKEGVNKLIKETKDRNTEYVSNLEKITETVKNDKFGLKDKHKETKTFIEASNGFLDLYSEIIFKLAELAVNSEDGKIDDNEALGAAFTLMGSAIAYQGIAEEYQSYIEEWAISTLDLLGGELIK